MAARPKGIDNVFVQVTDLQAAQSWYEREVGLTTKFTTPTMAVMQVGSDVAGVVLTQVDAVTDRATVWFEVEDAGTLAQELGLEAFDIATGTTVTRQDPWGNTVGFTDYTHRPELARD